MSVGVQAVTPCAHRERMRVETVQHCPSLSSGLAVNLAVGVNSPADPILGHRGSRGSVGGPPSQVSSAGVASSITGAWQAPKRRENDGCRLVPTMRLATPKGSRFCGNCAFDFWKAAEGPTEPTEAPSQPAWPPPDARLAKAQSTGTPSQPTWPPREAEPLGGRRNGSRSPPRPRLLRLGELTRTTPEGVTQRQLAALQVRHPATRVVPRGTEKSGD